MQKFVKYKSFYTKVILVKAIHWDGISYVTLLINQD